jgi:hypothetical protein
MGIAWETGNVFWVFDANLNEVVRYDFADDHGPGNDYHSDGKAWRYSLPIGRISLDIPCHLAVDTAAGLYIVDGGGKRVLRLAMNTGTMSGAPSFGPHEPMALYTNMSGMAWDIVVDQGLIEPSGIDVIGNRMVVSDHANGDIVIYDITTSPAAELGRLHTGNPGIMGITIAPDGNIWYVNGPDNAVYELEAWPVGKEAQPNAVWHVYPNPASHVTVVSSTPGGVVNVFDAVGRMVFSGNPTGSDLHVDVSTWSEGTYLVRLTTSSTTESRSIVVSR